MRFLNIVSLLLPILASVEVALGSGSCAAACHKLALDFGPRLHYYANDTEFIVWDEKQQETVYECRVQPQNATEVARILTTLEDEWCRFAVKCGGHSRFPDDSVSLGGVTIDLTLMNSVDLATDNQTARIGGGANTRQIFAALDPFGLSYVGGRIGSVGIGGYTLGGGTSVVSAQHGWALDNTFEYEVVLANSTIVTASETEHPDLYWALRGGGNNFGIVTAFTVKTFEQGPIYTGSGVYSENVTDQFLNATSNIFTVEDTNPYVEYEYVYLYSAATNSYLWSNTRYFSQAVMDPPVYDEFSAIPSISNSGSIATFAQRTTGGPPLGVTRNLFYSITHFPSTELTKKGMEIYKEEYQSVKNISGFSSPWISYSIPVPAIKNMKVRGGNALGIDVDGHLIITLLAPSWTNATDDETVYGFAERFFSRYTQAAKDLGVYHPYIYLNYANRDQDPFTGYGAENRERLTEIQKSIDPKGVFTSKGLWRGFHKVR